MARLALEHVTKRFGTRTALADVGFEVADGELLTLLGPSGSGKTTLLRAIAGLEALDRGRIALGDRDITRATPRDRNIALVFQDFALFPHLSVRANIGFGMRGKRGAQIAAIAERVRVAHLLARMPARLSGGERQRVAIARALATEPAAMLFDEPFASLDAPLRAELRIEIAELRTLLDIPAIFVTHDQHEALALGDRVAVMAAGRIVALAAPRVLLETPPTAFVARFVGTPPANVFDGAVRDGRFVADAEATIACAAAPHVRTIAIRPERVHVDAAGPLRGRVRFVETIGERRYATVATGGGTVIALADASVTAGLTVGLHIAYDGVLTYDADGTYAG